MSYDVKFRTRAIEYLGKGHSWKEVTEAYGISSSTLHRWVQKQRKTGDLSDAPPKPRKRKVELEELRAFVLANPDAYQSEIAQHFGCTQQSICAALKRAGITRKKRQNDIGNKMLQK